ncbi:hypothetical protein, partial [Pseudomonas aeruginosa]|uniref:hypothetical protein n=1 Tax=Pseudomonas aeruginosa TaxID=287 RepID=UPI001C3DD48C
PKKSRGTSRIVTDAITIQNPRNRGGSTGHVLAKRSVTFTEIRIIARLLGKQDESDCCAVRIEEVPETEVARMPAAKKSACCAPRIEKVPELEVAQTPTAKKSACCAVRIEEVKNDDVTQAPPATR